MLVCVLALIVLFSLSVESDDRGKTPPPLLRRKVGAFSDVGKRNNNEDVGVAVEALSAIQSDFASRVLMLVADGMGGMKKGELASFTCAERVLDMVSPRLVSSDPIDFCRELSTALKTTNQEIHARSLADENLSGMGTTVTAAVLDGDRLFVANIGDSRAYVVRDGSAIQITTDHSLVQELIKKGEISRDEAAVHPRRNVITRVVGYRDTVDVDTYQLRLEGGDSVLLCTDGLHGSLSEIEMTRIIENSTDAQQACERLVTRAKENGSSDNISAVLYRNQ